MSTNLWDQSIRHFIQQSASPQPTPGGGSVAALVGALAASMTSMVSQLSLGDKYAAVRPRMEESIDTMNRLIGECEQLLQSDIDAFETYMHAFKLPKISNEEKEVRSTALQQAAVLAIEVPIQLMEVCRRGIICTNSIAQSANRNVISDLAIGAVLFEAAAQSAQLTIEINLSSLQDNALKLHYEARVSALFQTIEKLKHSTLQMTRERLRSS